MSLESMMASSRRASLRAPLRSILLELRASEGVECRLVVCATPETTGQSSLIRRIISWVAEAPILLRSQNNVFAVAPDA